MFLELDKKPKDKVAVIDDSGEQLTYGDLCDFSEEFKKHLPKRSLIFLMAENRNGSLLGYIACLSNGIVPLILSAKTEESLYTTLRDLYQPEYLWAPNEMVEKLGCEKVFEAHDYALLKTGFAPVSMHPDLALLLPTSGSTGSPKLVRHSLRNIEANADNVRRLFQMDGTEKAMAILPMHYTMGLSVIASHLFAGATLLLSGRSLLDKGFWTMLK